MIADTLDPDVACGPAHENSGTTKYKGGVSTFANAMDYRGTWTVEYSSVTVTQVLQAASDPGDNTGSGISLFYRSATLRAADWDNLPLIPIFLNKTIAELDNYGPITFKLPRVEYVQFFHRSGATPFDLVRFAITRGGDYKGAWDAEMRTVGPRQTLFLASTDSGVSQFTIPAGTKVFEVMAEGGDIRRTFDGNDPENDNGPEWFAGDTIFIKGRELAEALKVTASTGSSGISVYGQGYR